MRTSDTAQPTRLRRSGNEQGQALLLIHGWAQDQRIFDELRMALNAEFDIYSYDRPGYGASSLAPNLAQEHLDAAQLVAEIGREKVIILGFSQGARIATRFASQAPANVQKLIICGGVMDGFIAESIDHHAIDLQHFKSLALAGEIAALRREWLQHPYCCLGMDAQAKAHLSAITEHYYANDLTIEAGHNFTFDENVYAQLVKAQIPTLFINGEYEAPPRIELAHQYISRSSTHRSVVVPGAGHMAVLSHSQPVADAIREFCL